MLLERLRIASKREQTSVSRLVQELVDEGLTAKEEKDLKQMYKAWEAFCGIIKDPVADTASSIDEILYGERGAWRGTMPDEK
jgi:predicted transcriptional regulator